MLLKENIPPVLNGKQSQMSEELANGLREENKSLKKENDVLKNTISALTLEVEKKNKMVDELTKWVKNLSDLNRVGHAETINRINEVAWDVSFIFTDFVIGFENFRERRVPDKQLEASTIAREEKNIRADKILGRLK